MARESVNVFFFDSAGLCHDVDTGEGCVHYKLCCHWQVRVVDLA